MSYISTKGKPVYIGDLDKLPTAWELHSNIVKLPEPVAWRLLGYKRNKDTIWEKRNEGRVTLDGTIVCIDGEPIYDRIIPHSPARV